MQPDGQTGRRLASARKDAHLSQETLAAELGVTLRTVQNYEAGRFVPYRHLSSLTRLLGRSSSWLLYGEESPRIDELVTKSRAQRIELRQRTDRLHELLDELAVRRHELDAMGTAPDRPDSGAAELPEPRRKRSD